MIPAHVLRELRYLEISTARAIRTARVGPYTSRTRGAGFDFDQHLPYRPGDDVRRIDWNVTARLNSPFVRQTHAERELDVIIAVDASRSMAVGGGQYSKKEVLTFVTGSLLFSAAGDQINTGFLAFADRVLAWSPPRRASGRSWHILEELWDIEPPATRTALVPALRHLATNLRTMSVVVIVSDFFVEDDLFDRPELRTLAATHDVIAVVVEDPVHGTLPQGSGYARVRDVESGAAAVVALNARTRRAYLAAADTRRRQFASDCYRLGMECAFVQPGASVMQPIIDLFARRKSA